LLSDVSIIKIPHKSGSLQALLKVIDSNGINIEYMYGLSIEGAQAYVVLKSSDAVKLDNLLTDNNIETHINKDKALKADNNPKYIYCTEFLINSANKNSVSSLRNTLSDIGDCTAVAEHSGIIKVHVHTNSPDKALSTGLEHGELTDIKIDNMRIQHGT
jgi:dihydroxyacetone kinase-like predicted kinase